MTAIHLGPQHDNLSRLYDPPEPRLLMTPRTLGAFTAVALLYAGGGMLMNLAGVQFKIPKIFEPPPVVFEAPPPLTPVTVVKTLPVTLAKATPDPIVPTPDEPVSNATEIMPANTETISLPAAPAAEATPTPAPAPATAIEPAAPPSIRNPSWLTKPTADQLARVYPRRAVDRGLSGAVTLDCRVTAAGTVEACRVLTESPKGLGFGDAALSATRYFRMSPRTVGGEPVEGAKVRIPMGFMLEP